jgi:hypothetical protein
VAIALWRLFSATKVLVLKELENYSLGWGIVLVAKVAVGDFAWFYFLPAFNLNRRHNHPHKSILADSPMVVIAELSFTRLCNYYYPSSIVEELHPETERRTWPTRSEGL